MFGVDKKFFWDILRNEDKLFPYAASAVASWVETASRDDLTEVAKDYEKQCQQARGFDFLFLKQKTNNNKHQHPVVQKLDVFFCFRGCLFFFSCFFFGRTNKKSNPTRMFLGGVGKRFSHQSFSVVCVPGQGAFQCTGSQGRGSSIDQGLGPEMILIARGTYNFPSFFIGYFTHILEV